MTLCVGKPACFPEARAGLLKIVVGSQGHEGSMSWSVHAGSGMSLIWHWQHSRLPGRLAAGYWQVHAVCMLGSIGTRQTAGCTVLMVVLWMPAKSSTDVARMGGSWSFPQNMHQPKSWLLAQAVVTRGSLPAFIRGPWANKRCDVLAGGGGGGTIMLGKGSCASTCFIDLVRNGDHSSNSLFLSCWATCLIS